MNKLNEENNRMMQSRVMSGMWWGLLHMWMIQKGFSEEVTFELKPERKRGPVTRQSFTR